MDKAAFPTEAQRIRPKLMAIAGRELGNGGDAEDIVQDALLRLWTICPSLVAPIDALAAVLIRNLCRDHLRRRHPTTPIDTLRLDIGDEAATIDDRYQRIMRLIDTLPALPQLVMRLRHIEGMEYSAIAKATGSTEAAVRKAISRARHTLRDEYLSQERQHI